MAHLEDLGIDVDYFLVNRVDLHDIVIVFNVISDMIMIDTLPIYNSLYVFFFTALKLRCDLGLIILFLR